MKKALLVIDVQNYFLKQAPSDLPARIAEYVKASKYEIVAFSQFRNLSGSNWEQSLGWKKCRLDEDLKLPSEFANIANEDNTYEKHTYSALKRPLEILKRLKDKKVEQIDICAAVLILRLVYLRLLMMLLTTATRLTYYLTCVIVG